MQRACDLCQTQYEAKHVSSRFCAGKCRTAWKRGKRPTATALAAAPAQSAIPLASAKVSTALEHELAALGVDDTYEAAVALGLARQLDSGAIIGAAYVSLSKEIDRRIDMLRLRAELPHDPARDVRERLEAKRADLRLA